MGKQCNRARSSESFANGKVTPVQVAFIVDRYLSDNNYIRTLSVFRSEATPLISKTKVKEAPKNLLSLGTIIDEYISLKEQKLMLDQEKCRVEMLLQGLQDVMQTYNSAVPSISQSPVASGVSPLPPATAPVTQVGPRVRAPAVHAAYSMYKLPVANSLPVQSPRTPSEPIRISTPSHDVSTKIKRKASRPLSAVNPTVKRNCAQVLTDPAVAEGNKESRATNQNNQMPMPHDIVPNQSLGQGSFDARSLMNRSPNPNADSPGPRTPPKTSTVEPNESVSPEENSSQMESSNSITTPEIFPINCRIISSKTIVVSPLKHVVCSSPDRFLTSQKLSPKRSSKIKGRLDFNDVNESITAERSVEAESRTIGNIEDVEMFDIDFPNFDVLGNDFSLSELLVDIDFDTEGVGSQPLQEMNPTACSLKWSGSDSTVPNQPDATSVLAEKDMNILGLDPVVSVKSVTKCIQILSPAKPRRAWQENF